MVFTRSLVHLRSVLQSLLFVPFAYAVFFNMIPTFLVAWDNATRLQERFSDNFRFRGNNSYDFIIVGGGSAGCVVANRLSAFYSVLLIEAGGPANPLTLVPGLRMPLLNRPQTDWSFKTVRQTRACLNSVNQECLISAGRGLGGSSNIDDMAFGRGHPTDFDNWAQVAGDQSWSYQQLLPFFQRSEEFIGSSTDAASRGRDGELRVREPDFISLGLEWLRGGQELGFPNVDFNGMYNQGFSILQYPLRRGMRQSTFNSFVLPITLGPRLRILPNAFVTRILFRDMSNMAYGVEYERFGRTELAIATREVILSSGAIGSPKLLMLSGIGPRDHLSSLGIPLRSDLPVGSNLQDHLAVKLGPFLISNNSTNSIFSPNSNSRGLQRDRDFTPTSILNWITSGRGPLSSSGLVGGGAVSSMAARARGEGLWPDIMLMLQNQGVHRRYPREFARSKNLMEDELSTFYEDSIDRDSFHIWVINSRPVARGRLSLLSTNPRDPPAIEPGYLANDADSRVLLEGIAQAFAVVQNTSAFRGLRARLANVRLPGCETTPDGPGVANAEMGGRRMVYWDCYIRRFSMSANHVAGTASIGSVVGSDLKVRGTRGLRVIDASIMPSLVSSGTLAATLAIAEKGSDLILREHGSNFPRSIPAAIINSVLGRNGILARNPITRLLSREFDRMNPLPSLFALPVPANRTDNAARNFNPFSRILAIFQSAQTNQNQAGNSNLGFAGILNQVLNNFQTQTLAVFNAIFGTGGNRAQNSRLFGNLNFLNPNRTSQPTRRPLNLNLAGNLNPNLNATNLFDIIFPVRNSTITLPNPFQNIFVTTPRPTPRSTTIAPITQRPRQRPILNALQNLFGGGQLPLIPNLATTPRPAPLRNRNPFASLATLFGTGRVTPSTATTTEEPFFRISIPFKPQTTEIPKREFSSSNPVSTVVAPPPTRTTTMLPIVVLPIPEVPGPIEPPVIAISNDNDDRPIVVSLGDDTTTSSTTTATPFPETTTVSETNSAPAPENSPETISTITPMTSLSVEDGPMSSSPVDQVPTTENSPDLSPPANDSVSLSPLDEISLVTNQIDENPSTDNSSDPLSPDEIPTSGLAPTLINLNVDSIESITPSPTPQFSPSEPDPLQISNLEPIEEVNLPLRSIRLINEKAAKVREVQEKLNLPLVPISNYPDFDYEANLKLKDESDYFYHI